MKTDSCVVAEVARYMFNESAELADNIGTVHENPNLRQSLIKVIGFNLVLHEFHLVTKFPEVADKFDDLERFATEIVEELLQHGTH